MKRLVVFCLAVLFVFSAVACEKKDAVSDTVTTTVPSTTVLSTTAVSESGVSTDATTTSTTAKRTTSSTKTTKGVYTEIGLKTTTTTSATADLTTVITTSKKTTTTVPTTTTTQTTLPTSVTLNRLPKVDYFVTDDDVHYRDVAVLSDGRFVVAGEETDDDLISFIRVFDQNVRLQEDYTTAYLGGYTKLAPCSDGGFIASTYCPPTLTKFSKDLQVEWVTEYEDPALEGYVTDVKEITPNRYAVLFTRTPHDVFMRKLAFVDGEGNLTGSFDLMKDPDMRDGEILPDKNGGFYLVVMCNEDLASRFDLLKEEYNPAKGLEVAVMHFDANIRLTWAKTYGGQGDDWVEEAALDENGDFLIAFGTNSPHNDFFSNMTVNKTMPYRRMLVKINQKGDMVYQVPLSNKARAIDQVFGIRTMGNLTYVTGVSEYFDGYQDRYPCEQISMKDENDRYFCAYTVCIDNNGKELDRAIFVYDFFSDPCGSALLPDGTLVIAGSVSTVDNPFNISLPTNKSSVAALYVYR